MTERTVFFVSDHTGITVELLGRSLLSQFAGMKVAAYTLPYVNDRARAEAARERIERAAEETGRPPLIVSSITDPGLRALIGAGGGILIDLFETFLPHLEDFFAAQSRPAQGLTHGFGTGAGYGDRIGAVDFALKNDDGLDRGYADAEVILVGVSRVGKTPAALYLALQFGVLAANYPLTLDDERSDGLPRLLRPWRERLFGLSIAPEWLHRIREARRSGSDYAALARCRREVAGAEALFRAEGIPFLDTSAISVEEIATRVLARTGIKRRGVQDGFSP